MAAPPKTLESALLAEGWLSVKQVQHVHQRLKEQPDLNFDHVVVELYGFPQQTLDQLRIDSIVMPRFKAAVLQLFLESRNKDRFAPDGDIMKFVKDITIYPRKSEVKNTSSREYSAQSTSSLRAGNVIKGDFEPARSSYTETTVEARVTLTTISGAQFSCPLIARNDSRNAKLILDDFLGLFHTTIYSPIRQLYKKTTNGNGQKNAPHADDSAHEASSQNETPSDNS